MHLYLEYFEASTTARRDEICEALWRNLNASFVSKITLFTEEEPPKIPTAPVELEVVRGPRQTYQSIIDYANLRTAPADIHVLVNNDISLDRGFEQLQDIMADNTFMALTRHELSGVFDGYPSFSQDAWAWQGRCRIQNGHFFMGVRGCDNRIAAEAYLCGYDIVNPCRNLFAYHHHRSRVRANDYHHRYVDPPYVSVAPCFVGQNSMLERMVGGEKWVRDYQKRVAARRGCLADQVRSRLKG